MAHPLPCPPAFLAAAVLLCLCAACQDGSTPPAPAMPQTPAPDLVRLAHAAFTAGDYPRARDLLAQARTREPLLVDAWIGSAETAVHTNEAKDAVEYLGTAKKLLDNADAAWMEPRDRDNPRVEATIESLMGTAHVIMGKERYAAGDQQEANRQFTQAEKHLRNALNLYPDMEAAKSQLDFLLNRLTPEEATPAP